MDHNWDDCKTKRGVIGEAARLGSASFLLPSTGSLVRPRGDAKRQENDVKDIELSSNENVALRID